MQSVGTRHQLRLRRLFEQGFRALDIAEPLISFDAARRAVEVRRVMTEQGLRVAGVRREGIVRGWVAREDLIEGFCRDHLQSFPEVAIVGEDSGLPAVFEALRHGRYAFVEVLGEVGGIVSRSDIGKPATRMWLFGMITLLEGVLSRVLREHWQDGGWRQLISAGRLEKAELMREERARRGERVDVIDCLQLTDKAHIVVRVPQLLERLDLPSRREGKAAIKQLEALRNRLAHAQDLGEEHWEAVLRLVGRMERLFEGTGRG